MLNINYWAGSFRELRCLRHWKGKGQGFDGLRQLGKNSDGKHCEFLCLWRAFTLSRLPAVSGMKFCSFNTALNDWSSLLSRAYIRAFAVSKVCINLLTFCAVRCATGRAMHIAYRFDGINWGAKGFSLWQCLRFHELMRHIETFKITSKILMKKLETRNADSILRNLNFREKITIPISHGLNVGQKNMCIKHLEVERIGKWIPS